MANDGSPQSAPWPLPKFYFQVEWDAQILHFQEASGLDIEADPIEYRNGDSPIFTAIEMPGLAQHHNVTLRRGVFVGENKFWDWFNRIKMNTVQRRSMTIRLLDESGETSMVWTMANAWPTRITATDLESEPEEVAIEMIEFAYDQLTVAND